MAGDPGPMRAVRSQSGFAFNSLMSRDMRARLELTAVPMTRSLRCNCGSLRRLHAAGHCSDLGPLRLDRSCEFRGGAEAQPDPMLAIRSPMAGSEPTARTSAAI